MYYTYNKPLTAQQLKKHENKFQRLIRDKNIVAIEKKDDQHFIYYNDGCLFTCKGYLPDNTEIIQFDKRKKQCIKKSLF